MDPPPKFASPGTPLFPLSPERLNGSRPPYNGLPSASATSHPEFGKPSLTTSLGPADTFVFNPSSPKSPVKHSRNNSSTSDALVQGMVARFDGLTVRDYKASSELAVKRAEMAREMAELERDKLKREMGTQEEELRKTREEGRKLRKEVEDGRERERKTSKRVDVLMGELHRTKEMHDHAIGVYEKEVKKSRKEAFKAGSSIVKLQEELKATRNSLRVTQSGLESEKLKSSKREQEAFTAQYQLVGLQEELEKARESIKVIEEERNTLKTSLREEEVARIAAEGMIALPAMEDGDEEDLLNSPRKSPRKTAREVYVDSEDKENIMPKKAVELKALQEELMLERRLRERAQGQIEFMKMECQFECCSCRIAEKSGQTYIHDNSYSAEMQRIKKQVPQMTPPPSVRDEDEQMEEAPREEPRTVIETKVQRMAITIAEAPPTPADDFDHMHSDFDLRDIRSSTAQPDEEAVEEDEPEDEPVEEPESPEQEPRTPHNHAIRTITHTTTIPIMFSPFPNKNESHIPKTPLTIGHPPISQAPGSPFVPPSAFKADGTLDREAALAQIRERRGRARSIALGQATPKKQMMEGVGRRDISAPALSTWTK
ncbi:hypothetical protein FKW77_003945 [Venturia effusa]|uniref:Uncharacterized protein n=1 Tax=Venturia effusa TaxID=50376 RepID=A0A517LPZ8_9PEZI|nr:hypothetical protein FKW77_003945 [Venturia effusa]